MTVEVARANSDMLGATREGDAGVGIPGSFFGGEGTDTKNYLKRIANRSGRGRRGGCTSEGEAADDVERCFWIGWEWG